MQKRIFLKYSVILGFFTLLLVFVGPIPASADTLSVDISRMAAITEIRENGLDSAVAALDEKKVADLVKQQPGTGNLLYSLGHEYERVSLEFAPQLLEMLSFNGITLTVRTSLGEAVFRPDQINMSFLTQPGVDPAKVIVRVVIGKASDEQRLKVDQYMRGHGMTGVINPVEFKIEAQHDNQIVELPSSQDYISQKAELPREVNAKQAAGVILNNNGQLIPVPTRFLKENGKNIALFRAEDFGTFTVVERSIYFTDVRTHWAKDDIDILASKLIVNGVQEELFAPEESVTRAQVAAMLTRALGLGPASKPAEFNDVKEGAWYYADVASVVEKGIMRGYPGGVFRPDNRVSREEVAVLASQVLTFTGDAVRLEPAEIDGILSKFKDWDSISPWARRGVAIAVKTGILKGTESATVNPRGQCSRAEFVVMLRRALVNAGLISPSVILASPTENFYTNQNILPVLGKAKPGNAVSVLGKTMATGEDGSFNTTVSLVLGTNTITLTDKDLLGNIEQLVSKVVYDTAAPILKVSYPNDRAVVVESPLRVEGSTDEECTVTVNDISAVVESEGHFKAFVKLNLGRNVLSFTAIDRAGNKSEARRIVYYSPNTISGFNVSPNPIRLGSATNIRFLLEQDAYVTLVVYGENGNKVKTLLNRKFLTSGNRNGNWDGHDNSGSLVPDGKYTFVAIATNSVGRELARCENTVVAARIPEVSAGWTDLPVFVTNDSEWITIPYEIKANSLVTITVFNKFSTVKILAKDLFVTAGTHSIIWDGKDETGNFSGDGKYTCVIRAVSAEVDKFKTKTEFRFIIESRKPSIEEFKITPNPVKINVTEMTLRYKLSEDADVTLNLTDKAGKVVAWILKGAAQKSGHQYITWNGLDSSGKLVPEGVYKVAVSAVDSFQNHSGVLTETVTLGYEPVITNIKIRPDPFYASGSNNAGISFSISSEAIVTVEIKVQWVTVKVIKVNQREKPGLVTIRWDGSDEDGFLVGEGRYDLSITAVSPTVQKFKSSYNITFDVKEPPAQS